MISWKLWAALRKPFVAHPIYQLRGVWKLQPPQPSQSYMKWQQLYESHQGTLGIVILLIMAGITIRFGPAPLMVLLFGLPFLLLFIGLPIILIIIGTLYGLASAALISDAIANEQSQGRYTLLGATPYGVVGASWALCTLEFHRHERMMQIRTAISSVYIMLGTFMGFPAVFTLLLFIVAPSDPNSRMHFYSVVNWGLIAFLPALDFVQSTSAGCLVGIITPMVSKGRANARALAVTLFLSIQFGTYLLVAFLCVLLRITYFRLDWTLDVSYTVLCVLIFFVCREIVLLVLWSFLAKSLDSEIDELEAITHVSIKPPSFEIAMPGFINNLLRPRGDSAA